MTEYQPIHPDDIRRLLAAVMAYDNRKPGQVDVAVWGEASRRGRWTYAEALDAVHQHYATNTTWLMPGHITQHIRAQRQDRAMRAAPPQLDAAGQARVRELTERAFHTVSPSYESPAAAEDLSDSCEFCGAAAGQPCTRPTRTGSVPLGRGVHPVRRKAG